jgi:hypothetical protein
MAHLCHIPNLLSEKKDSVNSAHIYFSFATQMTHRALFFLGLLLFVAAVAAQCKGFRLRCSLISY